MSILPRQPDTADEITKPDVNMLEDVIELLNIDQTDSFHYAARDALWLVRRQCQVDYSNLCSSVPENLRVTRRDLQIPSSISHQPPHYFFRGGLGYGSFGNDCMNGNYGVLSPDCQDAVDQVYQTRMHYWKTVTDYGKGRNESPDRGLVGALWMYHIIAFLACAFCYRRIRIEARQAKLAQAAAGNSKPYSSILSSYFRLNF